jgi:hypothetical protein
VRLLADYRLQGPTSTSMNGGNCGAREGRRDARVLVPGESLSNTVGPQIPHQVGSRDVSERPRLTASSADIDSHRCGPHSPPACRWRWLAGSLTQSPSSMAGAAEPRAASRRPRRADPTGLKLHDTGRAVRPRAAHGPPVRARNPMRHWRLGGNRRVRRLKAESPDPPP